MTKFYDRASDVVRRIYEKRIDAPAVLDAETDFPNATKFAANWEAIRDEAMAAKLESMPRFHDIMPEQADISANDGKDWRMLILKAYDVEVPENLARMPVLAATSRRVPRGQVGDRLLPRPAQAHPPASRAVPRRHALPSRPADSRSRRTAGRRRS